MGAKSLRQRSGSCMSANDCPICASYIYMVAEAMRRSSGGWNLLGRQFRERKTKRPSNQQQRD